MATVTGINIGEVLVKEEITEEEAIALAEEVERLEAVVKQLRTKIRDYTKKHGEIETTDQVWGYFSEEKIDFNPKALINLAEYLKHIGKNPFEYLSINKREFNKLKIDEKLQLQMGAEVKVGKRFKVVKKKED